MSELSLEALGYTTDEARATRRAFDLTTPLEQRAIGLRAILSRSSGPAWHIVEASPAFSQASLTVEKAA